MKFVFDTNAVSALMSGEASMLKRLSRVERTEVAMPQPVIAEISYGIERLPASRRRTELEARFSLVLSELARVEWTDAVSATFGELKAALERRGKPLEDFDIAIAAHAVAHGAVLVSANLDHMLRIPGLSVEDWAQPEAPAE